jgi:DNA invertase Pin-like site-specific DNA recombinase
MVLKVKETLHIYTRVSTSAQEEDGTSLETQKELGIKRAKELGFKYKVWNEGGQSSNKDDLTNRPQLSNLLQEIESDLVKHVFVFNTDRLSRNKITWTLIRDRLEKNNVSLYTATGQKSELHNPTDDFMLGVLAEFSAYENRLRAERSRLGKFTKIKQGFWMGGPPPYGYKVENKKLVPNSDEVKWVKFIFNSYKDKKPLRWIKQELLKNGVLTRRNNAVWSLGSIDKLLTNTHYGGYYFVKDKKSDETIRVECKEIVPSSLILQVQKERESRTRQTRVTESNQKHFYLLRDFLFCSECGSRYSGRYFPKQYRSIYYCPRLERNFVNEKTNKVEKCANRRYLKIEETDNLVWNTIVDVLSKSHTFKEEIKHQVMGESINFMNQQDLIKNLTKKIKKLDTEISDITSSIVNLETDQILKRRTATELSAILENIENARLKLEADRESLKQELYALENQSVWLDWIQKFGDRINKMSDFSIMEKYDFLKGVIEKIIVKTLDTQTHELNFKFRVPYVADSIVYKDKNNKKKGYMIKKGKNNLVVPLDSPKKS